MSMLLAQCRSEIIRAVRNRRFIFFTIVMPLAFYFIYVKQFGAHMRMGGSSWGAYFLMSMTAFGVLGASLNTVGVRLSRERKTGWARLLRTTPLPNWAYLTSKVVGQLLLSAAIVTVMFMAGALVENVALSPGQWIAAGVWLVLGSLPFVAIGIIVGLLVGTEVVQAIMSGLQLVLSMLGGLWIPLAAMPSVMRQIAYYTPTYRLGNVAWNIVGKQAPSFADIAILAGWLVVVMALSVRIHRRQDAMAA